MATFSGYMSIFNDYDLLTESLNSIRGLVSELVVVDGGYTWMESYLSANGKSPDRSCDEVYAALDASGIKYRVISRVWENEIEKRIAGYAACSTDYVYRIDADEIFFMSEAKVDTFVTNRGAVAQMDLPMYDSPGRVIGIPDATSYPRLGFLFDRNQISAEDHLHYLWLVLTADELDLSGFSRKPVHPIPVAFNAHLSNWRTPIGASQRAAFYILNYMRQYGAPKWTNLPSGPLKDFDALFEALPPAIFRDTISRSPITNSQYSLKGSALLKTPLSEQEEATFTHLYDNFHKAAQAHTQLAESVWQGFLSAETICFHRPAHALGQPGVMRFEFDCDVVGANGQCHSVIDAAPYQLANAVAVEVSKNTAIVNIPAVSSPSPDFVREILCLNFWLKPPHNYGHFKVASLSD